MSLKRRKRRLDDSLFLDLQLDFVEDETLADDGGEIIPSPGIAEGDPMTPEEAVRWLELNIESIRVNNSRTPYSDQDFIQEAYYAALEAFAVAQQKKISFEACFRTTFSRHIKNLRGTSVCGASFGEGIAYYGGEAEVETNINLHDVMTRREVEEKQDEQERLIAHVLKQMTPTQREVWTYIIKRRASLREASEVFGKDYRVISKIFHAGLRRIAEMYKDVDIREHFLGYLSAD